MSYNYKPVNLSALLEGALAAEVAADLTKGTVSDRARVAMLTGCIHALVAVLLEAEVLFDPETVARAAKATQDELLAYETRN